MKKYYLIGFFAKNEERARVDSVAISGVDLPNQKQMINDIEKFHGDHTWDEIIILSVTMFTAEEYDKFIE